MGPFFFWWGRMTKVKQDTSKQRELLQLIADTKMRYADKKLEREIMQEQWNHTLAELKTQLVTLKTGIDLKSLFD